jgi:hypothetical protein
MLEQLGQPLDRPRLPIRPQQDRTGRLLVGKASAPPPGLESSLAGRSGLDLGIPRQDLLELPVLLLPQPPGLEDLLLAQAAGVEDGAGDF